MHSNLSLIEQIKQGTLWDFPGGVHPPQRKSISTKDKIQNQPLPNRVYIPLRQHIGEKGELIVAIGDKVLKGQALTKPTKGLSLPVHASTSGVVADIIQHVSAHPSGMPEATLVIDADGQDATTTANPISNWQNANNIDLIQHIQQMGIAGLGGATFPTYIKMQPATAIEILIINAVECEPYITADDMLMRERAEEIVNGIEIVTKIVAPKLTVIAIEDNKPEAIESVKKATDGHENIQVQVVPTKYPSGGEKQLIEIITGQQVPSGKLPSDIGIVVQNIGTCFAIKQAVIDGVPLTERVVTVTGESITRPQNLWVRLGTPVADLLEFTGIVPEMDQRLIMGGPMMGFAIMDAMMPVVKATNCILAPIEYYLPAREYEQNCIRCGDCADACPAQLLPQQLLWYAKDKDHDKLNEYNLQDCIECGACAYVCPSQIPLVQYYRTSKVEIHLAEQEKIKSDKAKLRFEARQERLEKEKEARLQKHKEAAEKRKQAMAGDTAAKDKIAAALARAKAKKEQGQTNAPEPIATDVNQPAKDKVAAAIARAKAKKAEQANSVNQDTSEQESQSETSQKDKVAAAIARAKAKKQMQQSTEETKSQEQQSSESNNLSAELTPEELKKQRVAAAIAKAKAKKQSQQASVDNNPAAQEQTSDEVNTQETEELTPDEIKKQKVAAAIAKAKAKKLAQAKDQESNNEETE